MAAIELSPGATLGESGRYRLERVLGTGGMASVWLAADARLDREVAIKVLSDVLALDPDYVRRFEREARVAASLSHPHLVRVYDFSVDGPRPYLVMEYVAGGSLADRLSGPGAPQSPEARTWDVEVLARELLDALGYIHKAGVIHRDIKPANVLIGADSRARLTDFGIAQPSGATRLTKTGMVVGSGRYIAPEVMRGEPASERSDLYSLGVLIEQCLTPAAAPQLRALVNQLTAERPSQRPATARQAIKALEQREPTEPQITLYGKPTQRIDVRWSTVVLAVLLVLLAIALIGLASSGGASSGGAGSGGASSGGTSSARSTGGPSRANPNAPLSSQLTQLDRAIDQSRR